MVILNVSYAKYIFSYIILYPPDGRYAEDHTNDTRAFLLVFTDVYVLCWPFIPLHV